MFIAVASAAGLGHAQPAYTIIDIGIVNAGDGGSQAFGVSSGGVAVGRSLGGPGSSAWSWTETGGRVTLGAVPGQPFAVGNGANDAGQVAGTASQTFFGSGPQPIIWYGTIPTILTLPAGESIGRANGINASGDVAGSVDGGSLEQAVFWLTGSPTVITQTTPGGARMTTAFAINDAGQIAGSGIDPAAAARNVGLLFDIAAGTVLEVPALPGQNGTLPFGLSPAGHVVGVSSQNQSGGVPFIWDATNGTTAIPLPSGATTGSGRDANSDGWAVGNAGGQFAVPWLWDGTQTFRIQDLIPAGTGWDLAMNTSSSATGISDDGVIVGTGVLNGEVRAYALIPAGPTGCNTADVAPEFGVLNANDVIDFVNGFNAMTAAGDVSPPGGDGLFNANDVIDFVNGFNAGCP
jgi:hypothetical protein